MEKMLAGNWYAKKGMHDWHINSEEGNGNDIAIVREYGDEEEAKTHALLMAESKNMYQQIKAIVEYLKYSRSIYIEKNSHIHREFEQIIYRINS